MIVQFAKVIASLPGTLVSNTFYAIRTGLGFDLYMTDSTGANAHKLNVPKITSGPTAPVNPAVGDYWFQTT